MRLKCEIKIQMDSEKVISIFKDIDICSCIISQSLWNHFDIIHSLGTLWLHRPCAKQRFQTEDRAISMAYTNYVASILLAPKSCLKNSYREIKGHLRDPRAPRLSPNTSECFVYILQYIIVSHAPNMEIYFPDYPPLPFLWDQCIKSLLNILFRPCLPY